MDSSELILKVPQIPFGKTVLSPVATLDQEVPDRDQFVSSKLFVVRDCFPKVRSQYSSPEFSFQRVERAAVRLGMPQNFRSGRYLRTDDDPALVTGEFRRFAQVETMTQASAISDWALFKAS